MRSLFILGIIGLAGFVPAQSAVLRQAAINPVTKATELVRGSLANQKGMAVTADGRLWGLVYLNDGGIVTTDPPAKQDSSLKLFLYASNDGGTNWTVATQSRVLGSVYGTLVTDPDGYTLHIAYYARNGRRDSSNKPYYSIYYAPYDTLKGAWVGASDYEVIKGTNSSSGTYSSPDIAITEGGVIGITFACARGVPTGWVGGGGSWLSGLIWKKGGKWSAPHRLNVDSSGTQANLQVWGEDFYSSYRVTTGGYGISVRRFDTVAAAFGAEGEIPVMPGPTPGKNVSNMYANNVSILGIQPNGDLYVLFGRGTSHTGGGRLFYAVSPAGTYKFNAPIQIDDDPSMGWGNNTYRFFNLARSGSGGLVVLYSKLTESNQNLYMRTLGPISALPPYGKPPITFGKGTSPNQYYMISAYREIRARGGIMFMVSDTSVVGPFTGGRAVFHGASQSVAITKGVGCRGSLTAQPTMVPRNQPALGVNLNLDFSGHPANTSGFVILGIADRLFAKVIPLPWDLGFLGMTGCSLHTDLTTTLAYGVTANGTGSLALTIPNLVELKGNPLFFQGLLLATGANSANLLATGGMGLIFR